MADHSKDELACVYAALVLLDDDVAITVNIVFVILFSYYTGTGRLSFSISLPRLNSDYVCKARFSWCSIILLQAEKIQTILKAADVKVEPYWPGLFAKALEGLNLKSMITNVGSGVGAAPAAGAAAAGNELLDYVRPECWHDDKRMVR